MLRKNQKEAAREQLRLEDKLTKLEAKIVARNEQVNSHPRCQPGSGLRQLQVWVERHKLDGLVELKLEAHTLVGLRHEDKIATALELAGCYVKIVTTDVGTQSMTAQQVHDSYESPESGSAIFAP